MLKGEPIEVRLGTRQEPKMISLDFLYKEVV